jgi:ATP-dependent DNA helicase RecQ
VIEALAGSSGGARGSTMQALADKAGLSLRRASVIAAVLENMELVRRSGKTLALRRSFGSAELERFLATFEDRYDADRERIDNMMLYGQTTRCRMQFLREYFGEAARDACGHCDNCEQPALVRSGT